MFLQFYLHLILYFFYIVLIIIAIKMLNMKVMYVLEKFIILIF